MYTRPRRLLECSVHRDVVHQWASMVSPIVGLLVSCHGNKLEHSHTVENLQCPLGIRLYSSFSLMRQIIFFSWSLLMCTWRAFRTARQYSVCVLSSCLGDHANCVSDNHLDKEEKTTHNTMGFFFPLFLYLLPIFCGAAWYGFLWMNDPPLGSPPERHALVRNQ